MRLEANKRTVPQFHSRLSPDGRVREYFVKGQVFFAYAVSLNAAGATMMEQHATHTKEGATASVR